MQRYRAENLTAATARILEAAGSSVEEARVVAEHLVDANLAGHDSHGVGMLPAYIEHLRSGLFVANQTPEVVNDAGAVIVVDARHGLGQHMVLKALDLGIARAKEVGACVVAVRESAHVGRIGAYAEYCAAAGLASTHFVNVVDHTPIVAPFGGSDGRFITNPFCAALPGPNGPTPLLDMATSTIAFGKARVARNKGVPVPEGTLLDEAGRPTNDPTALVDEKRGALTAFGLHKGSGLAILCEVFAGALAGERTIQPENPRRGSIVNNLLSILMDPKAFGDPLTIAKEAAAFGAYVKASPPAPGVDEVLLPGEPEARSRAERQASGVPVDPMTIEQIKEAGRSVGLSEAELGMLVRS
ncbi:MAG: malate/lactate/ureidoglycolate dehydrogenase [Geminicoccaceae bacterium]|nr:MAG: malate/lactate/ureidoglycolate dehydrogenase [Geminicoccaceae bacterium]